ncbi:MAG TPA: TerC/Alx family metal homeostasis membrane protein, partial [Opitutaceae bacterium]
VLTSRRETAIDVKTALRWTVVWVAVALSFSIAIYFLHPHGGAVVTQYISGYLTELSLSVDNLFVFILIFSVMGVREIAQGKLIKLGIYLSIVLRVVFILFGFALLNRFHWLIYVFGALLIFTAWKMIAAHGEGQVKPEENLLYRFASRLFPVHAEDQETKRLTTRVSGKLYITPLFLVFLVIGSTDVLFAIDSIPAIMGISRDPIVVISSNIFAVLGLNSLFFAIRGVMGMFKFLKHGVSLILFLIGAKMVAGAYPPIDEWFTERNYLSLVTIVVVLTISILVSIWDDQRKRGGE